MTTTQRIPPTAEPVDRAYVRQLIETAREWTCDGFADGSFVSLDVYSGRDGTVVKNITSHDEAQALMAASEVLPALLAEIEALEQRVLPDPKAGCCCVLHVQDAGGGHFERLLEMHPACPEHSDALYDPRSGVWILREDQDSGGDPA